MHYELHQSQSSRHSQSSRLSQHSHYSHFFNFSSFTLVVSVFFRIFVSIKVRAYGSPYVKFGRMARLIYLWAHGSKVFYALSPPCSFPPDFNTCSSALCPHGLPSARLPRYRLCTDGSRRRRQPRSSSGKSRF